MGQIDGECMNTVFSYGFEPRPSNIFLNVISKIVTKFHDKSYKCKYRERNYNG